ncbi:MAG: nucleotidyltransferase family protein [Rhodovibrionaceae bacterium]
MSRRKDALNALSACLSFAETAPGSLTLDEQSWMQALRIANSHLLGALLWDRLQETGRSTQLPAPALEYLRLLSDRNAMRNAALRQQAEEIVTALNEAGIVPLLLKGANTLFDPADPLWRGRMQRDLDLLVPRRFQDKAVTALLSLGYRVHERYPNGHHAYGEFAREGAPGTVDLHSELLDPVHLLRADEVRRRSRPLAHSALVASTPCASDRILHHLLHAQIHHRGQFYRGELQLNQLFEFAVLAQRFGSEVDWNFIEARLTAHRLTVPLQSYLLAAGDLFGLRWPLAAPPVAAARRQLHLCIWLLHYPEAARALAPFANLRSAFAWHRMQALYGPDENALLQRLRHARLYLGKVSPRQAMQRVLR